MQDSARHDALRRQLLRAGAAATLPLAAGRALAAEPEKLRIGFQK